MRRIFPILVTALLGIGCSSSDTPTQGEGAAKADLSAMPAISLEQMLVRLKPPLEAPLAIALWRVTMDDVDAPAFLASLNALASKGHGLRVLALNVDFPAQLPDAVAALAGAKPAFEARAFQGDLMGLGAQLGWGGEPPPVLALFGQDGKLRETVRGKDALARIAALTSSGGGTP